MCPPVTQKQAPTFGAIPSNADLKKKQEEEADAEDRRDEVVASLLDHEALQRLAKVDAVDPQKVDKVKDMILAKRAHWKMNGKMTDAQLQQIFQEASTVRNAAKHSPQTAPCVTWIVFSYSHPMLFTSHPDRIGFFRRRARTDAACSSTGGGSTTTRTATWTLMVSRLASMFLPRRRRLSLYR